MIKSNLKPRQINATSSRFLHKKPPYPCLHKRIVICKDSNLEMLTNVSTSFHFVGKGIILFTLFYSSLNWWHYKRINDEINNNNKK